MERRLILLLALVSSGLFWPAKGAGGTNETFEGPAVSWRVAESDCRPLRLVAHERRFSEAHSGRACEFLQFVAGQGTSIYLAHPVDPARIIPELQPSLWVKSDRDGLQLLARVVFPRSKGRDGKPLTSLLAGDSYSAAGTWRQLRLDNLPQKLQREARNLRTQMSITVDEREAYIDQLVLNAFTGPGPSSLWIDDLDLANYASADHQLITSVSNPAAMEAQEPSTRPLPPHGPREQHQAALQGKVLLADGRPILVRAVEHRGETFAYLQSLGFNAIQLPSPPSEAQLAEANRADIWLIAPPPLSANGVQIEPAHHRVLAWFVGEQLTIESEEPVTRLVQDIVSADMQRQRPILLHAASGFSRFRHERGVLLLERPVLGTSFDLRDYGPWLAHSALHGRVDSPFWAAIPTEGPSELQDQIVRLSKGARQAAPAEPDQIRQLAYEALSRGARGLWFRSGTRLDNQDYDAKLRAATVHALNRELELVAPWASAGHALSETTTNNPHVRVFPLQTETSRLLIVSHQLADQQFVMAPTTAETVSFVIHGAPFSHQAYMVAPHGVESLPMQRGGGVRISLAESQPVSLILLTQDPLAVNYVGRVAAEIRAEYAARQLEIAQGILQETEAVHNQLASPGTRGSRPDPRLAQAQSDLRQADSLLDSGDARNAIQVCARVVNTCRKVRRSHWEMAVLSFPSPVSTPLCSSFSTLPLHREATGRLASSAWGINVLAAGDMEYLEHLLQSGWRQHRAEIPDVNTDVRLTLEGPRSGRSCLHLRTWKTGSSRPRIDGQWPITITSAPVSVVEGQLVRIHGWAKVPGRLDGSWDGLMIFDSQNGPALAERIAETQGWREFSLYRVAKTTGEFKLILAHTGMGESWIDDVSITVRQQASE